MVDEAIDMIWGLCSKETQELIEKVAKQNKMKKEEVIEKVVTNCVK